MANIEITQNDDSDDGEKKAKKESYEQGYLQGRLDSGNHDIDV